MRTSIIISFVFLILFAVLYFSDRYDREVNSDEIKMYQCELTTTLPFWEAILKSNTLESKGNYELLFIKNKNGLTINNTNIRQIPNDAFKDFPCLKSLNLNHNQLEIIPLALTDLPNLKSVSLQKNQLTAINKMAFKELDYLENLNFSHNPIKKLVIPNIPNYNFESFKCNYCQLDAVDTIDPIHSMFIKSLELNHNNFSSFPMNILSITRLKTLDLSRNKIASFTFLPKKKIYKFNYPNLHHLNLSDNKLTQFPSGVYDFPNLQTLYLNGNKLSGELKVKGLLYLKQLEITGQNLTSVVIDSVMHNDFGEEIPVREFLPSMNSIDLQNNKIEAFTTLTGDNHSIRSVNLSRNRLRQLPNSIYRFKNLEELNLSFNQLEEVIIDDSFNVELTVFDLSNNQIKAINTPLFTSKFKYFELVNLSYNRLTQIPYQFLFSSQIETLDLSNNNIKNMMIIKQPANNEWNDIKTLNLSNNPITSWDNSISQLPYLRKLDLSNTFIKFIPFEFLKDMPQLKVLVLKNTKIPKNQLEILEENLKEYSIEVLY
ncbi:MAG: leucine-rich repeat domain-containing protein [Saprospiraceae bacterium]